jgi:hypothetical protein
VICWSDISKKGTDLHEILEHAARKQLARFESECEPPHAETLLEMAIVPQRLRTEHAIFAAPVS